MNDAWLEIESGDQRLRIRADGSATLVDALRKAGMPLNARCGQRGLCDGCLVELSHGQLAETGTAKPVSAGETTRSLRACQHSAALGHVAALRIPQRSRLTYQPQVVTNFRVNVSRVNDPLWQQVEVAWDGDLQHLLHTLTRQRGCEVVLSPDPAAALPPSGRAWATLQRQTRGWALTGLDAQPFTEAVGAAIDVGTTTVAVLLVELRTGKVLATAAQFNQQMQLGDDVLTRINLCCTNPQSVVELQRAVLGGTIIPLLREVLSQAKVPSQCLKCCSLAGNTTMLHLLAGVNPASMGTAPFTPVFLDHRVMRAGDLPGWPADLAPGCVMHLLPGPAAYVGADLAAGILASGLLYDDGPSLLVDVGTNGEIIFKHGSKILGCATAAGPAFEGAGLGSGIRAGDGAIGHLRIRSQPPQAVELEVIGGKQAKPIGICGSGYIDFLAEARGAGLLNEFGRFEVPPSGALSERFDVSAGNGKSFMLAGSKDAGAVMVSEGDIAKLMAAKAAVAAGVLTLLERQNLTPRDVRRIYLAGGFGTHMSARHAIACGLLPGFGPEQIQPVGNSALAGAYLALLDSTALDEIARSCTRMDVVELNLDPGFEGRYIEQLSLP